MKLIFETVYDVNKVKNLILKHLTKHYFDSCSGYGISKKQQTDFAREDALKTMNSSVAYDDEFLQEVADFLNSISYPVTVYRGLATDNINDIKTGIKSGVHWTIDPEYIKNQTNLLHFKYVMIGKFNEQDIDFEKTANTYLHYSLNDQKHRYNKSREMEIWVKQRKEPKDLEIVTFEDFCKNY